MAPILPDQPNELVLTESRTMQMTPIEGYVYVLKFTSGTLKVGRTENPKSRLKEHHKAAQTHGHSVARSWVSGAHAHYVENEAALIGFCEARWNVASGREAFLAGDFDAVVKYAQGLPYRPESAAEVAVRQQRSEAAARKLFDFLGSSKLAAELDRLAGEMETIEVLANDENKNLACAMAYEVAKRVFGLFPAPWSGSDPTAAERYLAGRGVPLEAARRRAPEFELNFRVLFALRFRREAAAFADIACFCDSIDLGGAA